MSLALETFLEERPDRAINLAAGQNFALTGAAFAFDKTAGDASAGVGVFAIVDSKREKILSGTRFRSRYSGG